MKEQQQHLGANVSWWWDMKQVGAFVSPPQLQVALFLVVRHSVTGSDLALLLFYSFYFSFFSLCFILCRFDKYRVELLCHCNHSNEILLHTAQSINKATMGGVGGVRGWGLYAWWAGPGFVGGVDQGSLLDGSAPVDLSPSLLHMCEKTLKRF